MDISLKIWQEYLQKGIKYLGEGNTEEAEMNLQLSLIEAESLNVPVIIAFSQRLLATAQARNNKIDQAHAGFLKALHYCQQLKNNKGISEAKAGLAGAYFLQGETSQSVRYYLEAIRIYPKDSSPLRLAVLYSDLAQVYVSLKKWLKAEAAFSKAENLCQKNGYKKGEAEINIYLGEIYYQQKKNLEAKERFLKAARIFEQLEEEVSLASAHQYLAYIFLENNKIEEALIFQYRVISIYLKYKQFVEISESYYFLSHLLQSSKLYDEAENSLFLSLKYYTGKDFGLAVRYHSLAVIAVIKKEYQNARKFYFEALKYFQFYGNSTKIGEICEELTFVLKFEDIYFNENFYQWLNNRYFEKEFPKYELMLELARNLLKKGKNMAALRCGWKAMEIAQAMNTETLEIEVIIQDLSKIIRHNKRIK